jgi:hypothetical protein
VAGEDDGTPQLRTFSDPHGAMEPLVPEQHHSRPPASLWVQCQRARATSMSGKPRLIRALGLSADWTLTHLCSQRDWLEVSLT